jgi:hypothetical protein
MSCKRVSQRRRPKAEKELCRQKVSETDGSIGSVNGREKDGVERAVGEVIVKRPINADSRDGRIEAIEPVDEKHER